MMSTSDSDSDFEYTEEGIHSDSDASSDCGLLGKPALGIDPQEMKSYDGRSTPQNGSQFLLKVMAEKKLVPKVVYADISKLPTNSRKGDIVNPNYLDVFLQKCNAAEESRNSKVVNSELLPSKQWREDLVSNFSLLRAKVECWYHKIESKDFRLESPYTVPTSNDNTQWLKFCYGEAFTKLTATIKNKSEEEKLSDFFVDLNEIQASNDDVIGTTPADTVSHGRNTHVHESTAQDCCLSENCEKCDNNLKCSTMKENSRSFLRGHQPLLNIVMQLKQDHLEHLIRWNLLWLKNFGFINQIQGEWLYAILACLSKPVDPSVMSDIRSIARILLNIRNPVPLLNTKSRSSELGTQTTDDEANANHRKTEQENEKIFGFINTLNVFVYIIADYFFQKDLVVKL